MNSIYVPRKTRSHHNKHPNVPAIAPAGQDQVWKNHSVVRGYTDRSQWEDANATLLASLPDMIVDVGNLAIDYSGLNTFGLHVPYLGQWFGHKSTKDWIKNGMWANK